MSIYSQFGLERASDATAILSAVGICLSFYGRKSAAGKRRGVEATKENSNSVGMSVHLVIARLVQLDLFGGRIIECEVQKAIGRPPKMFVQHSPPLRNSLKEFILCWWTMLGPDFLCNAG